MNNKMKYCNAINDAVFDADLKPAERTKIMTPLLKLRAALLNEEKEEPRVIQLIDISKKIPKETRNAIFFKEQK